MSLGRKMKYLILVTLLGLVLCTVNDGTNAEKLNLFQLQSSDGSGPCQESSPEPRNSDCYNKFQRLPDGSRRRRAGVMDAVMDAATVTAASQGIHVPEGYNNEEPPPTQGKGVPVRFTVLVFSVRGINEIEQEVNVDMRLQIFWKDTRLDPSWKDAVPPGKKFKGVTLNMLDKIWFPDIFVGIDKIFDYVKAVNQPKLLSRPASLRYYNNTDIRYSTRITLKMDCPMTFHYYPADFQRCRIDLKSYAYTDDILNIAWHKRDPLLLLEKGLDAPNFALTLGRPEHFVIDTNSGHKYTGIRVWIQLKRQLSYHLIQTYLPSTLFVLISFLSFLVPPESVPGRMAICMTTLLTLTAMFAAVRQNIPKVSYVKALDIWMVTCVFFVFLALVEYAVVLNLRARKAKPKKKPEDESRKASADSNMVMPMSAKLSSLVLMRPSLGGECPPTYQNSSVVPEPVKEDIFARAVRILESYTWVFVVLLFVMFNLSYWPWLLVSSDYYAGQDDTLYYQGN